MRCTTHGIVTAAQNRRTMSYIVLQLIGGLGNQLFQYATGWALAQRRGCRLLLDPHTGFDNDRYGRRFELGNLRIDATVLDRAEAREYERRHRKSARALWFLERQLTRWTGCTYHGALALSHWRRPIYLLGYFQSPRIFADHREALLKQIAPRADPPLPENLALQVCRQVSISVHLRREHSVVLSERYYRDAVRHFVETNKTVSLYIFGDCADWWRQQMTDVPATIVSGLQTKSALEDFTLMRLCRHHIIANSTFSWWTAWLSEAADKQVIAPGNFSPVRAPSPRNVYPRNWIVSSV